jgi:hypothetical protein
MCTLLQKLTMNYQQTPPQIPRSEIIEHFDGELTLEGAFDRIKKNELDILKLSIEQESLKKQVQPLILSALSSKKNQTIDTDLTQQLELIVNKVPEGNKKRNEITQQLLSEQRLTKQNIEALITRVTKLEQNINALLAALGISTTLALIFCLWHYIHK